MVVKSLLGESCFLVLRFSRTKRPNRTQNSFFLTRRSEGAKERSGDPAPFLAKQDRDGYCLRSRKALKARVCR